MAYDINHTDYHPFICLLLQSFRCIANSYLTLSSSSMRALSLHAYLNTPEDIYVFHARLATPRPVMIHRDSSHGCIRQYIYQLVLCQKRCEVITSKKPLCSACMFRQCCRLVDCFTCNFAKKTQLLFNFPKFLGI